MTIIFGIILGIVLGLNKIFLNNLLFWLIIIPANVIVAFIENYLKRKGIK